jgi:hypothetical protein
MFVCQSYRQNYECMATRLTGTVSAALVEEEKPDKALELQCGNSVFSSYPIHSAWAYRESAFARKDALAEFCGLQMQASSLRREVFIPERFFRTGNQWSE